LPGPNRQGQGPGEAPVFHDDAGIWLRYCPWRSVAPHPDIPVRSVFIARVGYGATVPYLAADLLARPLRAATP